MSDLITLPAARPSRLMMCRRWARRVSARRRGNRLAVAVLLCLLATTAAAQSPAGTLSVIFDNDTFVGTDRYYTGGLRISWTTQAGPERGWEHAMARLLPVFPDRGTLRVSYTLAQRTYTPDDLSDPTPPPDSRPYAGWLYGAVGLMTETHGQLDQIQLAIGVVGPLALAEEIQRTVHALTGSEMPAGWDTQLHNEPALLLSYRRSWRVVNVSRADGFDFDITPFAGGALGNVFTYVSAGAAFRFGYDMTNEYGLPLMSTNLPGPAYFGKPDPGFGWYLFLGLRARAVAHNIFLDGNTFAESRSVDREPLVGSVQLGLALNIGDVAVAYTQVWRTRRFEAQGEAQAFGVVTLSKRF